MKLSIWPFARSQATGTGASSETAAQDGHGTGAVQRETTADARMWIVPNLVHARQLLQVLIGWGYEGQELLVSEIQPLYTRMCSELLWRPRPWLSIAAELRRITTGAKKLKRFRVNGEVRRLRVYLIIPTQETVSASAVVPIRAPALRSAA
jgi:hypothetical protein